MKKTQSESKYNRISRCRACESEQIVQVISFGNQPLANSFLENYDDEELLVPLTIVFCENCKLIQQAYTVKKDLLFSNYVYASSTSQSFRDHFVGLAKLIKEKYNPKTVVDIGSNDGVLLKPLKELGIDAIGVEPAINLADIANANGLTTLCGWIEELQDSNTKAEVVTACNVFAHVDDIKGFVASVKNIMTDDGVFIIEVASLLDLVTKNYYDTFYHEHFFHWSLISLNNFFKSQGMVIVDSETIETHGGSLRVTVKKHGKVQLKLEQLIARDISYELHRAKTFDKIQVNMRKHRDKLVDLIEYIHHKGKSIVGYGAPAKANTLLNYLQLNDSLINDIIDDNPFKQEKYTPGTHIVVNKFENHPWPDYILMLAWNFKYPIIKKLKDAGFTGKIIMPFPEVEVI